MYTIESSLQFSSLLADLFDFDKVCVLLNKWCLNISGSTLEHALCSTWFVLTSTPHILTCYTTHKNDETDGDVGAQDVLWVTRGDRCVVDFLMVVCCDRKNLPSYEFNAKSISSVSVLVSAPSLSTNMTEAIQTDKSAEQIRWKVSILNVTWFFHKRRMLLNLRCYFMMCELGVKFSFIDSYYYLEESTWCITIAAFWYTSTIGCRFCFGQDQCSWIFNLGVK